MKMDLDIFGEVSIEDLMKAYNIVQQLHSQTFQSAYPWLDKKEDPLYSPEHNIMAPRTSYAKETLLKCLMVLSENIKRKDSMLQFFDKNRVMKTNPTVDGLPDDLLNGSPKCDCEIDTSGKCDQKCNRVKYFKSMYLLDQLRAKQY